MPVQSLPRFVNRWGKLRQTLLPGLTVKDGVITLETTALSVLVGLLYAQKGQGSLTLRYSTRDDNRATAHLTQSLLQERTGYSETKVRHGISLLRQAGYLDTAPYLPRPTVKRPGPRKKAPSTLYTFIDPRDHTRTPLVLKEGNLFFNNNLGGYFAIPTVVITETDQLWSIASLKGSAFRMYLAILYMDNGARRHDFYCPLDKLQAMTDLDRRTAIKTLHLLDERGLVWNSGTPKNYHLEVCNPLTAKPLDTPDSADLEDWYDEDAKGVSRRLVPNSYMTREQMEQAIQSLVRGPVVEMENGLLIPCPFHGQRADEDRTGSLSITTTTGGGWHCFNHACNASGGIHKLLRQLTAKNGIAPAESIRLVAEAQGKKAVRYRPDNEAEIIYEYRNADGKTLKRVRRFPGKQFDQDRPDGKGGYKRSLGDLGAALYHLDLLDYCMDVVCVVEGERDADTLTALGLQDVNGWKIVGVTSGGAGSWHPKLAKHLDGKKVVQIPDDDKAGADYVDAVKASLEAQGTAYRLASLVGTGAKDLSDFIADAKGEDLRCKTEDLVRRMGVDWVRMPNGTVLLDPSRAVRPQPPQGTRWPLPDSDFRI